jgi:hypothetical protein
MGFVVKIEGTEYGTALCEVEIIFVTKMFFLGGGQLKHWDSNVRMCGKHG